MTPASVYRQYLPAENARALAGVYRIERVAAGLIIILLAPLLAALAVILFVLSRRGPLIAHARVGQSGLEFEMLKFRTMWSRGGPPSSLFAIERVGGTVPATKDGRDERVTSRFATVCRRYSLDELPQLYHVMRGEMSFVGPRPLTRSELRTHYGSDAVRILDLRPGLTGLWQIMGRSRLSYRQRRRLDLLLARKASSRLYLLILLRSIPKVFSGAGAC